MFFNNNLFQIPGRIPAYLTIQHVRPNNWRDADFGPFEGPLYILQIPNLPSKTRAGRLTFPTLMIAWSLTNNK